MGGLSRKPSLSLAQVPVMLTVQSGFFWDHGLGWFSQTKRWQHQVPFFGRGPHSAPHWWSPEGGEVGVMALQPLGPFWVMGVRAQQAVQWYPRLPPTRGLEHPHLSCDNQKCL